MSRQLKDLEAELQTALFIREQHHMTLTESGGIFQSRARQILSLINRASDEVKISNDELTGTLVIGCVESTISEALVNYIKAFR
ncbi:LysR family transcriptional regulator [Secundilactobacillus folii]|uniref:LysR family transcriptional regulator n=1 Tax=Secundilactobacillus folii TaxID=2678357 RepID=UPI001564C770|nr:LysR family transcriptional regulator [Secundilactobacillus folii]